MPDIIEQIIAIDQKAQETTEAAQREKLDCEKEIAQKVQALREDYLKKARRRIQINNEMDRTIMEQKGKKYEAHYDEQAAALEKAYADHRDEWVDQIVQRVVQR